MTDVRSFDAPTLCSCGAVACAAHTALSHRNAAAVPAAIQGVRMGQKIIAAIAGVTLVAFAAVGAFASQGGGQQTQGEPTVTDTATATPTEEGTSTPTATSTGEPDATDTPAPTDTPDPTVTATPTPGDEDGEDDDVHGIPDSNPSKRPNDDDVCEKGETDIKITPSGNRVNVPCHAANKDHKEKKEKHGDDESEEDEDEEDDEEEGDN
jgi:hypothetical protein